MIAPAVKSTNENSIELLKISPKSKSPKNLTTDNNENLEILIDKLFNINQKYHYNINSNEEIGWKVSNLIQFNNKNALFN